MDKYEENLLRLNHRIRDLIAQVDRLDTKNQKLHNENTVLVEDVARFRAQYALAEEGRLQCKSVVEKELERSQQQFEAHQLLKRRYNDLIKEYVTQNHKLKASEANATVRHSRIKRNRVPVEIIGKISDIGKPTAFEERMTTLENRCSALEKELAKAYTIIDDLEFELETIDHLEDLNDQLERQVRDLKVELELQRRSSLSSDHLALMTSPAEPHIQITTGADLSGTKQTSAPPESQKFGESTKATSGASSLDQNTNVGTISEMLPTLHLTEVQRVPQQPPVE